MVGAHHEIDPRDLVVHPETEHVYRGTDQVDHREIDHEENVDPRQTSLDLEICQEAHHETGLGGQLEIPQEVLG